MIIITICTVGYGDMSARTMLGRIISLFASFIGLLMTAMLIGIVKDYITLNEDEERLIKFLVGNK